MDEEEVWKCPKHPSKRRRSGICSVCLRDRLATLCPDCANVRPCACCATTTTAATTSSSSSSSSSFSRFSHDAFGGPTSRVSNLIESEPAFRRSRSLAIPFLRSRSRFVGTDTEPRETSPVTSKTKSSSFWSLFRSQQKNNNNKVDTKDENTNKAAMMMRSRSVAVSMTSDSVGRDRENKAKSRGWYYFPSPIKAFRQSKISKVVHERSPLYRGWFLFYF